MNILFNQVDKTDIGVTKVLLLKNIFILESKDSRFLSYKDLLINKNRVSVEDIYSRTLIKVNRNSSSLLIKDLARYNIYEKIEGFHHKKSIIVEFKVCLNGYKSKIVSVEYNNLIDCIKSLFNEIKPINVQMLKFHTHLEVIPVLLPLEDSKNIELLNPEDPNSNIYKVY